MAGGIRHCATGTDLRTIMRVIGAMSGSSLDGLDVACCDLQEAADGWRWSIVHARTVPYDPGTRDRLRGAAGASGAELALEHVRLGRFIAEACREVLQHHPAELIASHGHTVLHQPQQGFTWQIGCGATISALTGLPVVADLRSKDVAYGGQGAPLVPMGERHLFTGQDTFLNLGGIANISVHQDRLTGYDIGPCDQALDRLAQEAGMAYDDNGEMARSGSVSSDLLAKLDALPFFKLPAPRSLGREWFEDFMAPLIDDRSLSLPDRLATVCEHIGGQVGRALDGHGAERVLITGGGAHNTFLVKRIRANTRATVVVPDRTVVDYKEALIFAFLGLLRWNGRVNTLASVTGASRDSIGGAVYLPN